MGKKLGTENREGRQTLIVQISKEVHAALWEERQKTSMTMAAIVRKLIEQAVLRGGETLEERTATEAEIQDKEVAEGMLKVSGGLRQINRAKNQEMTALREDLFAAADEIDAAKARLDKMADWATGIEARVADIEGVFKGGRT